MTDTHIYTLRGRHGRIGYRWCLLDPAEQALLTTTRTLRAHPPTGWAEASLGRDMTWTQHGPLTYTGSALPASAPVDTSTDTCAHRWPQFHPPEDGWQAETCADCGAHREWHRAE